MRIPKVGERWTRHDGKANCVTVLDVRQQPPPHVAASRVKYRYDDGVVSEKYLPDFHAKFKPPAEDFICAAKHATLGVRCARIESHPGRHIYGPHEWDDKPAPEPAPAAPVEPQPKPKMRSLEERLVAAKEHYSAVVRAHVKSYYGYDPAESNALAQKQGDWDDPDYRARYCGFKK